MVLRLRMEMMCRKDPIISQRRQMEDLLDSNTKNSMSKCNREVWQKRKRITISTFLTQVTFLMYQKNLSKTI